MNGSALRCLTSSRTVPGAEGDQTDGQRDLDLDFIYFTTRNYNDQVCLKFAKTY